MMKWFFSIAGLIFWLFIYNPDMRPMEAILLFIAFAAGLFTLWMLAASTDLLSAFIGIGTMAALTAFYYSATGLG